MIFQYLKSLISALMPSPPPKLGTIHFAASEFSCRDGSPVPVEFYGSTQLLMEQLEVLREEFGGASIKVNSGYRSPEYNKSINGAKNSKHMLGQAADIKVAGYSPGEVADTIERLIDEGYMLQGGIGRYSSFCHYDVRGKRARWGSNS